jgi:excinuclease UvrABC nuclease subunit
MRPCIEMRYPEFSGCYALLNEGRVTYVGKSLNVLNRLSTHRNRLRRMLAGMPEGYRSQGRLILSFDSVRLYPCPMRELDILERELILIYKPECNVQVPRPTRAIDIVSLAKRARVDLDRWRKIDTKTYSQMSSRSYRRVA